MYTIGIDLGGTLVKIGLIRSGKLIDLCILPAQAEKGLLPNLPRLKETVNRLLVQNQVDRLCLSGVCMAFPGLVDADCGQVLATNEKYDDAAEVNLNLWCKMNWDVPFLVDNDARLAAVGEWKYGAGRGLRNLVMMTIGTGIGTGVVIDGRVLYGEHFQAGSLGGHFVVDYRGRTCTCGNVGCVEAMASSFFLPSIIREHPLLSAAFKEKAENCDFREIFSLAQAGDVDAILLRNQCMDVWSAAIVTYIHAYDPEVVVVGGGIMKSKEVILPYLSERVGKLAWCPTAPVRIVASELGDNAALLASEYSLSNKKRKNEHVPVKKFELR